MHQEITDNLRNLEYVSHIIIIAFVTCVVDLLFLATQNKYIADIIEVIYSGITLTILAGVLFIKKLKIKCYS